jgi:hypothetical protein
MVTLMTHPISNAIIVPSTNQTGWGTVRLESKQIDTPKRIAYIRGKITELEQVFKTEGQVFTGKIIHRQSFTPLYKGQKPTINPIDGKMFYLESIYTEDINAIDYWVTAIDQNINPKDVSNKQIYILTAILLIIVAIFSNFSFTEINNFFYNIYYYLWQIIKMLGYIFGLLILVVAIVGVIKYFTDK